MVVRYHLRETDLPLPGGKANLFCMSTVQEIEAAIEQLPPDELARLAEWVATRHHDAWARQMDRDAASGKLDSLFSEAETQSRAGTLRDWPGKGQ